MRRTLGLPRFTPLLGALLLMLIALPLFSETVAQQSFEAAASDTWSYTANPSPDAKRIWWGPTSEAMGGASAYDGAMYWAGWDLDNVESSLSFAALPLSPGYAYHLSFYYYTKNLAAPNDYCRYSVKFDNGTVWDNWVTVDNNSLAWTEVTLAVPLGSEYLRLRLSAKFDGSTKYAHWDYLKVEATPNTAPVVSNVSAAQRTDGSRTVDIWYDLYDANADLCDITVELSSDDGASYALSPSPANLSGDFGDDLPSGTDKHIIWAAGAESFSLEGSYLYRVYADDGSTTLPENFILVERGTFYNGTSDVTISSFYIDKYELTQAGYQAVMGNNPASGYGVGSNYPVYNVSWFNAIEYSNRRSLQEGLTPCYSYSTYGTNPDNWPAGWNTSYTNHTNVSCNWTANGYRLPTEMEWQFAARGGNQTHNYTYSGSNDLNAVAYYWDNGGSTQPYSTHTVGGFAPNELGTFDMSGNVWEWVWDIYGSYPSGSQNNPTGANSGSYRVFRGGCWGGGAADCAVSYRYLSNASYSDGYIGFRCVRVSP